MNTYLTIDEIRQYRTEIHRLICTDNHIDGCRFFFSKALRDAYYHYTKEITDFVRLGITPQNLRDIADVLRPQTKEWHRLERREW